MKKISRWDEIRYTRDWNSIFKATCMIAFFIVFFMIIFNRGYLHTRLSAMSKEGVTTGYIINRVEHTNFRQTVISGNQQYVDVIYFYYSYVVRGRTYYAKELLEYSIAIAQQLQWARKGPLPYPVTIRYDKNDPSQSVIWFK